MRAERFAAELPALFDDFPRSEHPSAARFDDVTAAVPNLATENTLALINLAVTFVGAGESYVEAGTYLGASLTAAGQGNDGIDLVGIDDFDFGPLSVRGRELPAASRPLLEANLRRFGIIGWSVLEGDVLEVLRDYPLAGRPIGVFFYDACHDSEVTLEALRLLEPHLADEALVIVDDGDWPAVRRAVDDYLASQPRARVLFDIGGEDRGQPWWWYGMFVLAWAGG